VAFDLGMDKKSFNQEEKIQELLQMTETEFDLVLLSEYMEVSMVLLADLMCWPLEDVTFLKLNARPKNQYRTALSFNDKMKLSELNNVDTVIYNYFRCVFKEDEKFKQLYIEKYKPQTFICYLSM
jgi:Galactose-3-O-sulfotransferase